MATKPLTIADFFAELDRYEERIPLDELVERLRLLDLDFEDVRPFVCFGEQTYRRNLMHAGRGYQALILCWRAGQRSPIHDHRGSSCGVRVIRGTVTETLFDMTPEGYVYPTTTHQLHEGEVCGSQDSDKHQISNLQPPGHDLVTMHIYSPPLITMGTYSLYDTKVGEFTDPIAACLGGDGI